MVRLLQIWYVYGTTFFLLQQQQPGQLHCAQRMAARHDEDATGDSTTPPKRDGQIAGPEDTSQLSKYNGSIEGGGAPDVQHEGRDCHRHEDNNNINLCFPSLQIAAQVQGDVGNRNDFVQRCRKTQPRVSRFFGHAYLFLCLQDAY